MKLWEYAVTFTCLVPLGLVAIWNVQALISMELKEWKQRIIGKRETEREAEIAPLFPVPMEERERKPARVDNQYKSIQKTLKKKYRTQSDRARKPT